VPRSGTDELLHRFPDYVASQGLTLHPAQEDAILGLFEGKNVILYAPTGSGSRSSLPPSTSRRLRAGALRMHLSHQGARQREAEIRAWMMNRCDEKFYFLERVPLWWQWSALWPDP
jgi:hypothetical protein